MKISKTTVEKLSAPETVQAFYWDAGLRGFGVRVTASGVRSYIVQRRINGKERRITIGQHGTKILFKGVSTSLTAEIARDLAIEQIASFNSGVDPVVEKKRREAFSVTLREVATAYCKDRRTKKGGELTARTKADINRHIEKSFPDWSDKPVSTITRTLCSERFSALTEKGATQANQAFRILRALLNYARETHRTDDMPVLPENPVAVLSGQKKWNPNKSKNGRIPSDKVGAVWSMLQDKRTSLASASASKTGADIVAFLLLTGCRWSEAAGLTWDRVDLKKKTWHIPDPKNHNPVTFPLPSQLCDILEARKRVDGIPYVFTPRNKGAKGCINNARPTMEQVSAIAGAHITPHDLRRTFMAIGQQNKVELWKLKLLTNHIAKGDVTIDHYTEKNDLRYLADVAELVASWVAEEGRTAAAIAASENVILLCLAA